MKALVLEDYKKFVYREVPDPAPGANDVLVAVKACGICGSDVHGMDGSTGRRRPPIVMGHEASGVIASVGGAVQRWAVGDRVTFDSTIYCGRCKFCQAGEINLCDNRRVLGVSCEEYRQNGAFAELVAVPTHVLYGLPEGVSFEHAALVEPFAIALHAIRRMSVTADETVVVVGAGMIGLAIVQTLRATGCGRLIVVDVAEDRLAMARDFGASETVNSSVDRAADAIIDCASVAFDAVGISATVGLAIRCLRKGGRLALVGNLAPKIEFPLQAAVTRELSIYGSCASRGEYPAVLEMLGRSVLKPDALISAVAPLAEGAAWFDRLYRKEPGLMKVLLRP
jgi:threonine dehydrogenase-like Zn-dependent dehydrogenase